MTLESFCTVNIYGHNYFFGEFSMRETQYERLKELWQYARKEGRRTDGFQEFSFLSDDLNYIISVDIDLGSVAMITMRYR